jgi:hypothetical protein
VSLTTARTRAGRTAGKGPVTRQIVVPTEAPGRAAQGGSRPGQATEVAGEREVVDKGFPLG